MSPIDRLKKRINKFDNNHGRPPRVWISKAFWEANAPDIAKLAKKGVDIAVDENLLLERTFVLENPSKETRKINTVNDLKNQIDRLVEEGRGDWPVVHMPSDSSTYHKIKLFTIIPGEAPHEGLELFSSFHGAPEAEHILVQIGE